MTRLLDLMTYWIGEYNYNLPCPDWAWILSAILVLIIVFGSVSVIRSIIRKL